jgi:CBS domain-containing protein
MGFTAVYDYVAGKADWGSAGLPIEGTHGSETRVGAHLRRDVPTCGLDERLDEVCARVRAAGWDTCFVVNEARIVLGRLGRSALVRDGDIAVEHVMALGPSTVRPSFELAQALERMRRERLSTLPVTTSEGRLLGLLHREHAERALEELTRAGSAYDSDAPRA